MKIVLMAPALLLIFTFLFSTPVHAAGPGVPIGGHFGFGNIQSLGEATSKLVPGFFSIASFLVIMYFLAGAFKYIRAGGNKEEVEGGKQMIVHAIIGFLLLMLTFLVLQFILSSLFGVTSLQIFGNSSLNPANNINQVNPSGLGKITRATFVTTAADGSTKETELTLTGGYTVVDLATLFQQNPQVKGVVRVYYEGVAQPKETAVDFNYVGTALSAATTTTCTQKSTNSTDKSVSLESSISGSDSNQYTSVAWIYMKKGQQNKQAAIFDNKGDKGVISGLDPKTVYQIQAQYNWDPTSQFKKNPLLCSPLLEVTTK